MQSLPGPNSWMGPGSRLNNDPIEQPSVFSEHFNHSFTCRATTSLERPGFEARLLHAQSTYNASMRWPLSQWSRNSWKVGGGHSEEVRHLRVIHTHILHYIELWPLRNVCVKHFLWHADVVPPLGATSVENVGTRSHSSQNKTCYCKTNHETTHCWGGHWPPGPTPLLVAPTLYETSIAASIAGVMLSGLVSQLQITLCCWLASSIIVVLFILRSG